MRILIAEDVHDNRKNLIDILKDYGEYDIANDGLEAFGIIFSTIKSGIPYDLICLSIMLPKMDGFTVLKLTRDIEKQFGFKPENRIKIIITAELDDRYLRQAAFGYGCDGFIEVPNDDKGFKNILNKLGF